MPADHGDQWARTWYLAICQECNAPPNRFIPVPFADQQNRDTWRDAHHAATGHHVDTARVDGDDYFWQRAEEHFRREHS